MRGGQSPILHVLRIRLPRVELLRAVDYPLGVELYVWRIDLGRLRSTCRIERGSTSREIELIGGNMNVMSEEFHWSVLGGGAGALELCTESS